MKLKLLLLALLLPLASYAANTNAFNSVLIKNNLQITAGSPGVGKFWISDAIGNGLWTTVAVGDVFRASNNVYNVGTTQYFHTATVSNTLNVVGNATFDGNITLGNAAGDLITGTGTATFTPVTTHLGGIRGSPTGVSAAAGNIGEYLSAQRIQASGIALTTVTGHTVLTLTLTAGDWDVGGLAQFNPGAATTFRELMGGFTTTTNAIPNGNQFAHADQGFPAGYTLGGYATSIFVPSYRFVCTTTTNLYMNVYADFATSTMTGYGFMTARRSSNAK